jgi:hypothetical protein
MAWPLRTHRLSPQTRTHRSVGGRSVGTDVPPRHVGRRPSPYVPNASRGAVLFKGQGPLLPANAFIFRSIG